MSGVEVFLCQVLHVSVCVLSWGCTGLVTNDFLIFPPKECGAEETS